MHYSVTMETGTMLVVEGDDEFQAEQAALNVARTYNYGYVVVAIKEMEDELD